MRIHHLLFVSLFFSLHIQAQDEKLDMTTIQKIRQEGLQDSHVMDIAFHLTDASGDRLTASPGFMRAANYARQQLEQWGLTDAVLDPLGGVRQRVGTAKVLRSPHRTIL